VTHIENPGGSLYGRRQVTCHRKRTGVVWRDNSLALPTHNGGNMATKTVKEGRVMAW
jgi:hypothetical protein